ncbi:sterol desaturase family protein [Komagataeibacter pomaceti]|nr:sterol desaturase family protein [Novacetimonas pomaceti]
MEEPVRLFRNSMLERLTLLSFRVFLGVWLPLLAMALAYGAWRSSSVMGFILWTAIGFAVWFPTEYLLHRFLFHLQARYVAVQSLVYLLHGNHHEQPNHPLRNLMPLSVTIPLAGVIWGVGIFMLGSGRGGSLAAGFFGGYVFYDVIHYSCHQFPMRGPLLRRLKIHHINHHYRDHHTNYGITSTFIDRTFHTLLVIQQKKS